MKLRLITFIAATMTALYAFAQHGEGKSNIAQLTAANEPKNNGAATCHRPIQFAALAMEL